LKTATAAILIFLVFATSTLPIVVKGKAAYVPHEDPDTAENTLDAYSFLTHYADILALVASKDYQNASSLIDKLKYLSIPEDMQYIINRYNNLTQQLTDVLNSLETQLNQAQSLLNQYRLSEAAQILKEAGILVAKAQILLSDLQDATTTLSQKLGVFAAPAQSKLKEAYNQLQSILQKLAELLERYHELLSNLNDQMQQIENANLQPTQLTLSVNATTVFVGEHIRATGTLKSSSQNLPNREVTLFLDDQQAATVEIDTEGNYQAVVQIPYRYVHNMTLKAVYTPTDDDHGRYLATSSPTVTLNIVYYETTLHINVADKAYPGLPTNINGNVTTENGAVAPQRTVKVLLDDVLLTQGKTDQNGYFNMQSTLNAQTPTGKHDLTVTVESQGIYQGATQTTILTVEKIASNVQVQAPTFALLPTELYVEGKATAAAIPIENAQVNLTVAATSITVKTAQDGSFNAIINIPWNTILAGVQDLNITVTPTEPWRASTQAHIHIFVVSSANVGFTLTACIATGALLYTKLIKPKTTNKHKLPQTLTLNAQTNPTVSAESPVSVPKPEFKLEGTKGKIIDVYLKALNVVEAATGNGLEPQMTLREFLHQTQPKIGNAAGSFAKLTGLAEKVLYSSHMPDDKDTAIAQELATTVREVLQK
jgi:DNA-binding ferritin-like protein